jgi:hypothetical protein
MLVLGTATALATSLLTAVRLDRVAAREVMVTYGRALCVVLATAMALKLLFEASLFRHLRQKQNTPLRRSALLMSGELAAAVKSRYIAGFLGGIAIPGMLLATATEAAQAPGEGFIAIAVGAAFFACLAGELIERYLFFTAVSAPKMPGGLDG